MNSTKNYSKSIFRTEYGNSEKNQISEMDNNNNQQYCLTNQLQSNKQKLLDFISDKNKLILKTYFDRKGAKEFLLKKNKALERIELDTTIENEDNEKNENNLNHKNKVHKKKTHKSPKNRGKIKSLNKENTKESLGIKSFSTKKKKNKYMSSFSINKFTMNGIKNKNELGSTEVNNILGAMTQTSSIIPKCKNKKKVGSKNCSNKKKKKLDLNKINNTKLSFNSEYSMDSNNFKNRNDYENFKNFIEKDDSLITEIITELESGIN